MNLEHHAGITFLFGGGRTATVIHKCWITVYSESSPNYCATNRSLNKFKWGHQSLEGDLCFSRPSDAMNQWWTAAVQKTISEKQHVKVPYITKELHISVISVE